MISLDKITCLFFDQVNIYGNFRPGRDYAFAQSTELSTVFVDNTPPRPATRPGASVLLMQQEGSIMAGSQKTMGEANPWRGSDYRMAGIH